MNACTAEGSSFPLAHSHLFFPSHSSSRIIVEKARGWNVPSSVTRFVSVPSFDMRNLTRRIANDNERSTESTGLISARVDAHNHCVGIKIL
jgi:hypothetical protein